jgi:hypothetical protein
MAITRAQKSGQILAVVAMMAIGLFVVNRLPNPAWETDRLADSTIELSVGLEKHWEEAYIGRLGASDVEKWEIAPTGWRRSGNGWRVGQEDERFEVGTWKETNGQNGFALIYYNIPVAQCKELTRLLGDAFDQHAVNDRGQLCNKAHNKVVFYRNPA